MAGSDTGEGPSHLRQIYTTEEASEEYKVSEQLIKAKIGNLESNMFIEIDMERIEDRSKALSYIGIEIAESLKYIPAPISVESEASVNRFEAPISENIEPEKPTSELLQDVIADSVPTTESTPDIVTSFFEETRFETKPSLWQKFKNSKFVRTIKYIMQIKVVLDYPALPEGRGE